MPNSQPPKAMPRSISFYVLLGAASYAFIQMFSLLAPILLSFILILLISLALNPVVSWMRVLTVGRSLATGLIVAALVGIIALTGWAFFAPMKASVTKLSDQLPRYWERLQKPLIKMEQQAVISEEKLAAEVAAEVTAENASPETPQDKPKAEEAKKPEAPRRPAKPSASKTGSDSQSLRSGLGEMLQGVVGSVAAVAFNGAQIFIVLVTVSIGVIFTLMNPRPVFAAMFSLLPEGHHPQALAIVRRVGKFAPGWAGATLMGMLAIGVLVFLLMLPIFGFMDALVLGMIAFILEAVPYLGPILAAVSGLLFALGEGGMTPLWVVLAYGFIQALENNLIVPLIMARGLKMHPVAVIFSMLLCVAAFGVLGVLVAAPLVAIADILHDELYRKRWLPSVTDADLDRLARNALHEKPSDPK